jgi:hypothetical protein
LVQFDSKTHKHKHIHKHISPVITGIYNRLISPCLEQLTLQAANPAMALFSSSFTPGTPVISGSSSTTNPFAQQAHPTSSSTTTPDNKLKRPRESDATSTRPTSTSTPIKEAYEKRATIVSAQSNLEKLMKKVGMTGPELTSKSPQIKNTTHSTTTNTRPAPTSKKNKNTPSDPPADIQSAFPPGPTDPEIPSKKRKIKHGLDGRPTNANGGVPAGLRADPLAGLLGKGKGKKEKKAGGSTGQGKAPQGGMTKGGPSTSSTTAIATSTTSISQRPISPSPEPPAIQPTTPMTTLQNSLSNKLESAKFRWLNEQLYTQPSGKGLELMRGEGGRAFEDVSVGSRCGSP